MAALPHATRASTVVCKSAAVRATHTTFAPASASAVAYARPNPRDAPVTIVVCPRSFSRAYSDGILIVVAPAARIAEHYFFGVFILLRATISEEDSPRVAIAVIPEQCAKRRPPFSSSWQIGREIQCSCPRQERCQEPRKQWNRLFRYRLFE